MKIRGLAVVLALLGWLSSSQAGLYNTAEDPTNILSTDMRAFRETLIQLYRVRAPFPQQMGKQVVTVDSPMRKRALLAAALVPARGRAPTLSEDQLLNLSAYLVRLRGAAQPGREGVYLEQAAELLKAAVDGRPKNFLLLANLGTAYQTAGDLELARRYLVGLRADWPRKWSELSREQQDYFLKIGWDEERLLWFRRAEEYQLRLVLVRLNEQRRFKEVPASVDAIFSTEGKPLRFIGPSGEYEPGKLADSERAKLPEQNIDKAILLVEQLLVWLPEDYRLQWLLAELFNARGDVRTAAGLMEELVVQKNQGFHDLRQHRQILRAYLKEHPVETPFADFAEGKDDTNTAKTAETPTTETADPPNPWRLFAVGFATGFILAIFAYWQLREIQRRRQHRSMSSAP